MELTQEEKKTVSRDRVEYTTELVMAEQMITYELYPFTYKMLDEFTEVVFDEIHPPVDCQVSDDSTMCCGKSANI